MKTILRTALAASPALLVAALLVSGCEQAPPPERISKKQEEPAKKAPPKQVAKKTVDPKVEPDRTTEPKKEEPQQVAGGSGGAPSNDEPPMQPAKFQFKEPPAQDGWKRSKPLGENVWLETKGEARRVLVGSLVCLREGQFGLECLLCKRGTKEHESILVTTANAKTIHAAMEVAKMKAGSPVQFDPKFAAPKGDKIKVTLLFEKKGKWMTVPAQSLIRNVKTKKDLDLDWVFAGSKLYQPQDDATAPPVYLANTDGAYISIANVSTAMLDLPIDSPKSVENRVYEPNTNNIPPLDTSVTVILEPSEKK
jgi:hypothetical protein